MAELRRFRLEEVDVEILKDHCRDAELLHAYETWVEEYAPKLDDLVSRIAVAFRDNELGDGTGLFEAQGLDDYASAEELAELRRRDLERSWREITVEELEGCYAAPTFMDARGFVYYIPAFLTAELKDQSDYGYIKRLYDPKGHPSDWDLLLTSEQRAVLIDVLVFVAAHPEFAPDRDAINLRISRCRKWYASAICRVYMFP